jgi:hypothetical protein
VRKRHGAGRKNVASWLRSVFESLRDEAEVPLPVCPRDDVPTTAASLRALHVAHPLVQAWIELLESCSLWKWLRELGGEELRPDLTLLGGLGTRGPDLNAMCRVGAGGPLLRPRPGRRLLVLHVEDLGLRALARILLEVGGDATLADVFGVGQAGRVRRVAALRCYRPGPGPGSDSGAMGAAGAAAPGVRTHGSFGRRHPPHGRRRRRPARAGTGPGRLPLADGEDHSRPLPLRPESDNRADGEKPPTAPGWVGAGMGAVDRALALRRQALRPKLLRGRAGFLRGRDSR